MVSKPERPTRTPVSGPRNILTVLGKDPNYVYRWVNDTDAGMRLERFKEAGWEIVNKNSDVKVGDKVVDKGTVVGSAFTRYVGQGSQAVLMRIPKEWYDEDQAAKQASIDEIEAAMRSDLPGGDYGSISVGRRV